MSNYLREDARPLKEELVTALIKRGHAEAVDSMSKTITQTVNALANLGHTTLAGAYFTSRQLLRIPNIGKKSVTLLSMAGFVPPLATAERAVLADRLLLIMETAIAAGDDEPLPAADWLFLAGAPSTNA